MCGFGLAIVRAELLSLSAYPPINRYEPWVLPAECQSRTRPHDHILHLRLPLGPLTQDKNTTSPTTEGVERQGYRSQINRLITTSMEQDSK